MLSSASLTPALVSPLTGLADISVSSLNIAPEQGGGLQDAHEVFVDSTEVVSATTVSQQVGNSVFSLLSFGQNPTDKQVPGLKSILRFMQQQNGGQQVFQTTKKLYTYITNEAQFVYQKAVGATQAWVQSLAQIAYTQVTGFDARATVVAKAAIADTDGYFAGGSVDGSTGNLLQKRGQAAPTMTCTRNGPGNYTVEFGPQKPHGGYYPTVLLSIQSAEFYSGVVTNAVIAVKQVYDQYAFTAVINDFSGGRAGGSGVPVDQNWYFLVL